MTKGERSVDRRIYMTFQGKQIIAVIQVCKRTREKGNAIRAK